jgi:hypothetical protein
MNVQARSIFIKQYVLRYPRCLESSDVTNEPRGAESFLGAFAELRNAAVSFVVSVRLSAWNNLGTTGQIFMKFGISVFFESMSRKLKFH